MSSKKWVLTFLITVLALASLLAGLNFAVDPFGAFGDRLLQWFSYDETNNPRVAKFTYLEQNHDRYDSYILGCSSTSSLPVDAFNDAFDASFYNLTMYGADMRDCEKIASYLIENYTVRNLILNVYLDNGLTYDDETDPLTRSLHYREDPAHDYSDEQLTRAKHTYELKPEGKTVLSLDYRQGGIGSNSCGPRPMEKYLLSFREPVEFTLMWKPYRAMDASLMTALAALGLE